MPVSLERLSTGIRINRAQDDAAGLILRDRFAAQVNGFQEGIRNVQTGMGMIRVAELGLNQVTQALQRTTYHGRTLLDGSIADAMAERQGSVQVQSNAILANGGSLVQGTAVRGHGASHAGSVSQGTYEIKPAFDSTKRVHPVETTVTTLKGANSTGFAYLNSKGVAGRAATRTEQVIGTIVFNHDDGSIQTINGAHPTPQILQMNNGQRDQNGVLSGQDISIDFSGITQLGGPTDVTTVGQSTRNSLTTTQHQSLPDILNGDAAVGQTTTAVLDWYDRTGARHAVTATFSRQSGTGDGGTWDGAWRPGRAAPGSRLWPPTARSRYRAARSSARPDRAA